MIAYFDTSALVPLLVAEPGSIACSEMWDNAEHITTIRLTYIEAVAALAMAERMGRITAADREASCANLNQLWLGVSVLELDKELMSDAANLAVTHGLRGYDATHCAAALSLRCDDNLVAVTGDQRLLTAWRAEGLAVSDINR